MNQLNGNGHKIGRPSLKTPELCELICRRLSEGETLIKICEDEQMPDRVQVYRWRDNDPSFATALTRARDNQAEYYQDQIINISDEAKDRDSAAAAKIRVDSRIWFAKVTNPRKYADKATEVNVTAQMVVMDASRMKALQERSLQAEGEVLRIETPSTRELPNEETGVT